MLPLEFVVFGTPIAGRGPARQFWIQKVKEAALARLPGAASPSPGPIIFRLGYYYVAAPAADLDNIVKPVQDALKGLAYLDDIQVVDLVARMRPKANPGEVSMSAVLLGGLKGHSDFLHVLVEAFP